MSIGQQRHGDPRLASQQHRARDRPRPESLAHLVEGRVERAQALAVERELHRVVVLEVAERHADEPWPGYDEQSVPEIRSALADADEDRAKAARDYERAHKNRSGVLETARRELTSA